MKLLIYDSVQYSTCMIHKLSKNLSKVRRCVRIEEKFASDDNCSRCPAFIVSSQFAATYEGCSRWVASSSHAQSVRQSPTNYCDIRFSLAERSDEYLRGLVAYSSGATMHGFPAVNIVVCSSSFSRQSSKESWRTMKNNEEACYEVANWGTRVLRSRRIHHHL